MSVTENQIEITLDRILVATDFTPGSDQAVSYAKGLAKHFAAGPDVSQCCRSLRRDSFRSCSDWSLDR